MGLIWVRYVLDMGKLWVCCGGVSWVLCGCFVCVLGKYRDCMLIVLGGYSGCIGFVRGGWCGCCMCM